MPADDTNSMLAKWLTEKGYTEAEINKILVRLAERDQQTLSDSIFDSIGSNNKSLDQLIGDILRD